MSSRLPTACVKMTDDALEGLLLWHTVLICDAELADGGTEKCCGTIETSMLNESRSTLVLKGSPSVELASSEIEP